METALLVIDVQKDYFPGGKMELKGSVEAGSKIKNIIESFRNRGKPIIPGFPSNYTYEGALTPRHSYRCNCFFVTSPM